MSDSLWLQLPRVRLVERGYGVTQRPLDVIDRLSGNFAIDPLTGYATPPVTLSMLAAMSWDATGDEWFPSEPFVLPGGDYGESLSHRSVGDFATSTTAQTTAGHGFFLAFTLYGDPQPLVLAFGANSVLIEQGLVTWSRSGEEVGRAQLWGAEEWSELVHYLYVYAIGGRIACRRVGSQPRPDLDPGLLIDTGETLSEMALPAAALTVAGADYASFAVAPERHETSATVLHATMKLPEESTQEPVLEVDSITPAGCGVNPELVASDETGAGYQVTVTMGSATGPNAYVTRVRLTWPELAESDEVTPVDLCTFTPAGLNGTDIVKSVEVRRGPEPESCGLRFDLLTVPGDVAPYLQPHMLGRWEPGGVPALTFFTSRPTLRPDLNMDGLSVECQSAWKQMMISRWPGGVTFAGQSLSDVYAEVAHKSGLPEASISVYSGGVTLPEEAADDPAMFDFAAGTTVGEVLLYLRDQFASTDRLTFKADGKLYIEQRPSAASGTVYYWTTPANEIAGVATNTSTYARVLDWTEGFVEDGLANDIWVYGRDRNGKALVAVATDWDSVRNPLASNYVAGFRRMTLVDAALTTQGLCNQVARQLLEKHRWPRLTATLSGTAVAGLYEQDIIEVDGKGLWRILSMATIWDRVGTARTSYELEYFGEVPSE